MFFCKFSEALFYPTNQTTNEQKENQRRGEFIR